MPFGSVEDQLIIIDILAQPVQAAEAITVQEESSNAGTESVAFFEVISLPISFALPCCAAQVGLAFVQWTIDTPVAAKDSALIQR